MNPPGEGLAEKMISSVHISGEASGDTSDECGLLDKLLVDPAGRLDTEDNTEGLKDRPRLAIVSTRILTIRRVQQLGSAVSPDRRQTGPGTFGLGGKGLLSLIWILVHVQTSPKLRCDCFRLCFRHAQGVSNISFCLSDVLSSS